MSSREIDRLVEARIRAAQADGGAEDLPGQGKPLDLDDLNGLTPEQRSEALLFRTLGEVPEEVALLREITAGRAALSRARDEAERERIRADLRAKAAAVKALIDLRRKEASYAHARRPGPAR